MLELEIQNFQSILHTTVSIDGFTAILGRSNIGKSSIVRAMRCALTGAVGTDFVRHGPSCERFVRGNKTCSCFSSVAFKSPDLTFTWEKGDKVNRYKVFRAGKSEPEVYDGLDRGTPEFLSAFQQIQVGSGKELVQIPTQFEPIFLLNQSGPTVADVLSDVARLDDINKAMSLVSRDRKSLAAKRKVREEDVSALTLKLQGYDGLDNVPVEGVEALGVRLRERQRDLVQLEGFIQRLRALKEEFQALDQALALPLPEADPLVAAYPKLTQVESFIFRVQTGREALAALTSATTPSLGDSTSLFESWGLLQRAQVLADRQEILTQATDSLAGASDITVPEVSPVLKTHTTFCTVATLTDRLGVLTTSLKSYANLDQLSWPVMQPAEVACRQLLGVAEYCARVQGLQEAVDQACSLNTIPEVTLPDLGQPLTTLAVASRFLVQLEGIRSGYEATRKESDKVEQDYLQVVTQLEEIGTCPTCSQPLNGHLHGVL